jgi:transposase InsO family protein
MGKRVERWVPKERADPVEAKLGRLGFLKSTLPKRWPRRIKSASLHVFGVLRVQLAMLRAKASDEVRWDLRADAREAYVRVLVEENAILRRRLASIDPRKRPHYAPEDRLKILELRAANGWTLQDTASRFLVSVMTLTTWMKRIDEQGEQALVRAEPVNKYPQWVTRLVVLLALVSPLFGNRRVAQFLGRMGLALSASTVRRRRKEKSSAVAPVTPLKAEGGVPGAEAAGPAPAAPPLAKKRATGTGVTSKHENHVWHIDLTWLSFSVGNWVPWPPFSLPTIFPFGLHLAAVMDQWTRRIVGWKFFLKEPSAAKVVAMLEAAVEREGRGPKHIISDQGTQFGEEYLAWCEKREVRPRFGAVGESRSIAVLERFWRSLKEEWWRRLVSKPWFLLEAKHELEAYLEWYHEYRPHQGLGGLAPSDKTTPAPAVQRIEPRLRMWLARGDPARSAIHATQLHLRVERLRGREHLPVITLHA